MLFPMESSQQPELRSPATSSTASGTTLTPDTSQNQDSLAISGLVTFSFELALPLVVTNKSQLCADQRKGSQVPI